MDANMIQEVANNWSVLVSMLIVGLVQVVKTALPVLPARMIPLINLVLGVFFMVVLNGFTIQGVVAGMMIGFAASGLWSSGKTTVTGGSSGGGA